MPVSWSEIKSAEETLKVQLYDEEQDLEDEEDDNQYNNLLNQTKIVIKQLRQVRKKIDPILFDIKDGSLVRTRPSRYKEFMSKNLDARSYVSSSVSNLTDEGESCDMSVSAKSARSK